MADLKPASRLRLARVRAGYRVGALATAIDVAESTIFRLEEGRIKDPSLRIRKALTKALGAKEADLFGDKK